MRRKTTTSKRSIVRRLGLFVCAASVVATLAGVARSQSSDPTLLCLFNVTNFCLSNSTVGSEGSACCVQNDVTCLQNCLAFCKVSRVNSNSQCVQICVAEFQILLSDCVGRFTNTTVP
jgi:hypothetical protein